MKEKIGEKVIYQQGTYRKVQRWYKGWHPDIGVLTHGHSGEETVTVEDIVSARPYLVKESPPRQL